MTTLEKIVNLEATIGEVLQYMMASNATIFKITPKIGDDKILCSIVFMMADEAKEILPAIQEIEDRWEKEDANEL